MIQSHTQLDKELIKGTILEQYAQLRDDVKDGVVLFDMGAFYDTYFDDARFISSIASNYTLTKKEMFGYELHQLGIPKKTLEFFVQIAFKHNVKVYRYDIVQEVAISEEEDSKNQSAKKRQLTRIYTPGTVIEDELLEAEENNYILSLYYDNNVCYLSYADVSTGQFYKTKASLAKIAFEVDKIEPVEVLISKEQKEIFKEILKEYKVVELKEDKFKGISIDNVLLNYCKEHQLDYCVILDDVIEYKLEDYLLIDYVSRRCLEMTRNKKNLKRVGSLYWFMDNAKTFMGKRLLKKYLSEPLLDVNDIKKRQEAIAELLTDNQKLDCFVESLTKFCDLSRLCSRISNATIEKNDLQAIMNCSDSIYSLKELCKNAKSEYLKLGKFEIENVTSLIDEIQRAIFWGCYLFDDVCKKIIKDGYDSKLDYLWEKLENKLEEVKNYEQKMRQKTGVENLKIIRNSKCEYFIEVTNVKAKYIYDNSFKLKNRTQKLSRYATDELGELETEINDAILKIDALQKELFNNLRTYAKNILESVRKLANEIATVDVFVALAVCARENNLTCPVFVKNGLKSENAFHPCLLKLNNYLTKNDIEFENEKMIILTGANMSGKSTYMKTNAIISILGQMGSFVPAQNAQISLVDKIFVRQGSTDDIVNNNSSFMVEMNDLRFIIDNATSSSLILLDEPAKSTNQKEGGAIVRAFCEYIVKYSKAKTMIITHNFDIANLEDKYPNRILSYKVGSREAGAYNDKKIRRGIASTSCAIDTAILAELPYEIINLANNYLNESA